MATVTEVTPQADEWLERRFAAEMLGVPVEAVTRMGRMGRLTTRTLPGTRTKYSRRSIETLLAASIHEQSL